MSDNNASVRRFRITVPSTDKSVMGWLAAQSNVSYSVRELIKDSIRRDGFTDVTCREVRQLQRRGRPPRDDEADYDDTVPVRDEKPARTVSSQPQAQQKPTAPAAGRDDEGFVDPEKFFG